MQYFENLSYFLALNMRKRKIICLLLVFAYVRIDASTDVHLSHACSYLEANNITCPPGHVINIVRACYSSVQNIDECGPKYSSSLCRKEDSINRYVWKQCENQTQCLLNNTQKGVMNCNSLCYSCTLQRDNSNRQIERVVTSLHHNEFPDAMSVAESIESLERELKAYLQNNIEGDVSTSFDFGLRLKSRTTNFSQPSPVVVDFDKTNVTLEIASTRQHAMLNVSKQVSLQVSSFNILPKNMMSFLPQPLLDPNRKNSVESFLPDDSKYFSVFGYFRQTEEKAPLVVNFSSEVDLQNLKSAILKSQSSSNHRIIKTSIKPSCFFINLKELKFSDKGCITYPTDDPTKVNCMCNHTTVFTILLTVSKSEVSQDVQIVSYIMQSITCVCLIFTIAILHVVKHKVKNGRFYIQANLCLALFFLHFVSLFSELAIGHQHACEFVVVMLHFSVLASGGWMSVEGLTLFLKTSRRTMDYVAKKSKTMFYLNFCIGWVSPFLVVIISASVGFYTRTYIDVSTVYQEYRANNTTEVVTVPKYDFCWLSVSSPFRIVTVIIPLAIIWVLNSGFAIKTFFVVARLKKEEKNYMPSNFQTSSENCKRNNCMKLQPIKSGLKSLILLFPALGLPWIFLLHAGGRRDMSDTILYVNAILNGLQGFFIFLVFCVFSREVKDAIKTTIRQRLA